VYVTRCSSNYSHLSDLCSLSLSTSLLCLLSSKQHHFHQNHINHHPRRSDITRTVYCFMIFNSSMVGRTSAVDMSERLAPDNAAPFVQDAAVAVVDDAAAVAVADCRSIASMDARCKAAVSSYRAVFDCIRRLTAALTRLFEWESDYHQWDLRTVSYILKDYCHIVHIRIIIMCKFILFLCLLLGCPESSCRLKFKFSAFQFSFIGTNFPDNPIYREKADILIN